MPNSAVPQFVECHDSDAPGEVPHMAERLEDRCGYHHQQYERWKEREKRQVTRVQVKGAGRGPREYVKVARPRYFHDVGLTRSEAREITLALGEVALLRAGLDIASQNNLPRVSMNDVRPLLAKLDELTAALTPLHRP